VLASGLVFSMFFVLLVVPVLFVIVEQRSERKRGRPRWVGNRDTRYRNSSALLRRHSAGPVSAETDAPRSVDLALKQNSA